jgi:FKBP-type peptidyl-prolyl cis-trans isomerase
MKIHEFLLQGFLLMSMMLGYAGCREKPSNSPRITQEDLINMNRQLVNRDADEIKKYIKSKGLKMKETQTGLWYSVDKEGKGDFAVKNDIITLKYELRLTDGTLCYSSDSLGLKKFVVGQGGVESGLEDAVLMLRRGSQATFILPPHLAHGLIGDDNKIPSRAILIYAVEVIDIEK